MEKLLHIVLLKITKRWFLQYLSTTLTLKSFSVNAILSSSGNDISVKSHSLSLLLLGFLCLNLWPEKHHPKNFTLRELCIFFILNLLKLQDDSYTNGTSNGTVDPVFRKIQKYATAFHIWRVEVRIL